MHLDGFDDHGGRMLEAARRILEETSKIGESIHTLAEVAAERHEHRAATPGNLLEGDGGASRRREGALEWTMAGSGECNDSRDVLVAARQPQRHFDGRAAGRIGEQDFIGKFARLNNFLNKSLDETSLSDACPIAGLKDSLGGEVLDQCVANLTVVVSATQGP